MRAQARFVAALAMLARLERSWQPAGYVVDADGQYAEDADGLLYRIAEEGRPERVSRRW